MEGVLSLRPFWVHIKGAVNATNSPLPLVQEYYSTFVGVDKMAMQAIVPIIPKYISDGVIE